MKDIRTKNLKTYGAAKISKEFKRLARKYPAACGLALYLEAAIIFEDSQEIVPVASGNLRKSGLLFLRDSFEGAVVIIGYGTAYALRIHEDTSLDANRKSRAELSLSNPSYKTKLSVGGSSKYLQKPFEDAEAGITSRLAKRVRMLVRKKRRITKADTPKIKGRKR